MTSSNGQEPQQPQGPPWMNVPAEQLIQQLTAQITTQGVEMAAMRIYIDQLHQIITQLQAQATMEAKETEDVIVT